MCATRAHLGSHLENKKRILPIVLFCFDYPFWGFRVVTIGKKVKKKYFCFYVHPSSQRHYLFIRSSIDLPGPRYLGILPPEGERRTGSINC
jgi:hypothetical protein